MATWVHIVKALRMTRPARRNKNVQTYRNRMRLEAIGSAVFARFRPSSLKGSDDLQVDVTSTSVI